MFEFKPGTSSDTLAPPTSVERISNTALPLGAVAYVGAMANPGRISTEVALDCVKSISNDDPVLALIREARGKDTTD